MYGLQVIVIIASGVLLSAEAGLPLLTTPWIAASLAAFALSGILFGAILAPMQRRLLKIASEATVGADWPSPAYRRTSNMWELVGIVSILLPLSAVALMVFKPATLL